MLVPIESIEEFYAHALAIEREAAGSYRELRDYFAGRGEEVLAGLCGNLAHFEQDHYELLAEKSRELALPTIPDDRYRWLESGSPERVTRDLAGDPITPRGLLEIALKAERGARRFFDWVAGTAASSEVRALAQEMAREEAQHVEWVSRALEYVRAGGVDWDRLLAAGGGPRPARGA